VDRLGQHAEVSHHRNADVDQTADHIEHGAAAFDLDRSRATFLQQPAGIADRFADGDLVAQKRHIGHDERTLGSAAHGARMMDHRLERNRQRGFVTEDDHAERIADEQRVDPRPLEQPRHGRIVRGQHRNLLGAPFHFPEIRHTNSITVHRSPFLCHGPPKGGRYVRLSPILTIPLAGRT
jgi:hypothetical protein